MSNFHKPKLEIPKDKEAYIQSALTSIEAEHSVRFLFAIESGSRAWGFPSPDSDFDVRFVYARQRDWYLDLFQGRDVIEVPLEGDWDINGWDVRKAIQLLLKPNPVLLEWLASPIRYRWDEASCEALLGFATSHVSPQACAPHYFHLARKQWQAYIDGAEKVNLKKYFYVLRPTLALRWLRLNPDRLPPMNLHDLLEGADVSGALKSDLARLLEIKAASSEVGVGDRLNSIDTIISEELHLAEATLPARSAPSDAAKKSGGKLFRDLIGAYK